VILSKAEVHGLFAYLRAFIKQERIDLVVMPKTSGSTVFIEETRGRIWRCYGVSREGSRVSNLIVWTEMVVPASGLCAAKALPGNAEW